VVFLILIAIWAAVLVPSWVQSRREVAPARSMATFRRRMSTLERTAVDYEAYSDDMYLDAPDLDRPADGEDDDSESVEVIDVRTPARPAVSQFRTRPDVQPQGAVVATQRAGSRVALHRRRRIFFTLALTWLASLGAAVYTGSIQVLAANGAATLLFFTYVWLLVMHHKRALEHAAKVRYLAPARTPRPAVVVLRSGSGAAQ